MVEKLSIEEQSKVIIFEGDELFSSLMNKQRNK
jgi:hypothetical protein